MFTDERDEHWMHRALALAAQGVGLASPNPTVGCVIVNADDQMVGEGFHRYDERDHAEVVALKQAGGRARGATAYVTLEPCSHTGRTGPCADALMAADVARVVVATRDANPVVRGNGVGRLRAAGVAVDVGVREREAQQINRAFAKFIRTGIPWVTLKAALSLDDRIAPAPAERKPGEPFWLTGADARAEVHRMRHAHDALLTGIGTVLADGPLLTDRSGLPRRRPLLRVVLDSRLRLPLDAKVIDGGDLLVFTASTDSERAGTLRGGGVRVEAMADGIELDRVLARLGALNVTSLMIEAGTSVNTAALAGDLVDELVLFRAPVVLGDRAVPFLHPPAAIPSGIEVQEVKFGDDTCTRTVLKSYWS